jgi:hypothetical protein
MDAQFMGFWPGQGLVDRKQAIEPLGRQPLLLVDQCLADHRDLRNRSAPRKEAEAEEGTENGEGPHVIFVILRSLAAPALAGHKIAA